MDKDFITLYSLKELSELDNHHPSTIKNSKRYIKVKIENNSTRSQYKAWYTKKPYGFKYIRYDDVKKIIEDQFWKKLVLE